MKYPMIIITVMVGAIILFSFVPGFITATTHTEERTNDGAGWVRFNYSTSKSATIDVSINDDTLTLGGSAPQTGELEDMIIWADAHLSVYIMDGDAYYIGDNNGTVSAGQLSDNFTISKNFNGVKISDGEDLHPFPASYWAYIPNAGGNCAFFPNGTEITLRNNYPVVAVGSFAGMSAYSNFGTRADIDLIRVDEVEDNVLSGIHWDALPFNADVEPLVIEPVLIPDLTPINPLNPNPIMPMSVPTPTYTDGDWGYDLKWVDGLPKAKIVSYSGSSGNIDIPASVGGYEVIELGKGVGGPIFPDTLGTSTVTIPNTVLSISAQAFRYFEGLTAVTIPSSVTSIGSFAFSSTGLETVIIPDSVNSIDINVFFGCENLKSAILPNSLTYIPNGLFYQCHTLETVIIPSGVTSIGKDAFTECYALTTINIPSGVTSIGTLAFSNCIALESIEIPNGVTELSASTFYGTTALTKIIIPPSVASVSNSTFYNSGLTDVLNFSDYDISHCNGTNGAYLINYANIETSLPALGYISSLNYTVSISDVGPAYVLIRLIPLVLLLGLAIYITYRIKDRDNRY